MLLRPFGPLTRCSALSRTVLRDLRHVRGERVVVAGVEAEHPRRFERPGADLELDAEDQRYLAVHHTGAAFADLALDPVDQLDDLDPAGDDDEEGGVLALMHGVLARLEADVGGLTCDLVELGRRERREQRYGGSSSTVSIGGLALAWKLAPRLYHAFAASPQAGSALRSPPVAPPVGLTGARRDASGLRMRPPRFDLGQPPLSRDCHEC